MLLEVELVHQVHAVQRIPGRILPRRELRPTTSATRSTARAALATLTAPTTATDDRILDDHLLPRVLSRPS